MLAVDEAELEESLLIWQNYKLAGMVEDDDADAYAAKQEKLLVTNRIK